VHKLKFRPIKLAVSLFVWIALWLFFSICNKYHLLYVEGTQMFLFTKEYLTETILHPGGVADFISRFLIQFYHYPLIGGAIIATFLIMLQYGVEVVSRRISGDKGLFSFSFIPLIFYCALLCNENYTLAGLIGMVFSVWAAWLYININSQVYKRISALVFIPVLWLLFGGGVVSMILLVVFYEIVTIDKHNIISLLFILISSLAIFLLAPMLTPLISGTNLILGARYFRLIDAPLIMFLTLWSSPLIVVLLIHLLPSIKNKVIQIISVILVLSGGAYIVNGSYMYLYEEVFGYLNLVQNRKWEEVIEKAKKRKPSSMLATNCINLALGETGQMGEKMFDFFQYGNSSLMQDYKDDILFSGEILFNLGLINEAQRYAYESMESIPDQQKGVIFVKRLAETNLVAGRDEVASKYLRILGKTLFYKQWSQDRLKLVGDSVLISEDPVYGHLRKIQPDSNFVFMSGSLPQMLEILLRQHPDNHLAYDYLMASCLLTKSLGIFAEKVRISSTMPRHYKEALVLLSCLNHQSPDMLPSCVKSSMIDDFENFITKYNAIGGNPAELQGQYGKTYWYYITYTKM